MITIYHNPRCRKSRECLAFLKESGKEITVINYFEEQFTKESLTQLIKILKIEPIQLIRQNEAIWKSEFKGTQMSDQAIISAMVSNPKLIERPIVVKNNEAVIARPLDRVHSIV